MTVIKETPACETDFTWLTPGVPLIEVSSGKLTNASTSCATSPGASVSTITCGGDNSGKTSMLASATLNPPQMIRTTASTTTTRRLRADQSISALNMIRLAARHPGGRFYGGFVLCHGCATSGLSPAATR